MAELKPLHALHYDPRRAGASPTSSLLPTTSSTPTSARALVARSPFNVVEIDLPEGEDRYDEGRRPARSTGAPTACVVADAEPALWALTQDYTGPDGAPPHPPGLLRPRPRRGIRPRPDPPPRADPSRPQGGSPPPDPRHPGQPLPDLLALLRSRRRRLAALAPHTGGDPWGEVTDPDGTVHRLWRVGDPAAVAAAIAALADTELLIADGHHRYETARVYAEEIGGEGPHRYVLMCLVALEDPGLTVFPTHRLAKRPRLRPPGEPWPRRSGATSRSTGVDTRRARPTADRRAADARLHRQPPQDPVPPDAQVTRTSPTPPSPTCRAPTAASTPACSRRSCSRAPSASPTTTSPTSATSATPATRPGARLIDSAAYDVAFLLRPTPIQQVRDVAAAGQSMPPEVDLLLPQGPDRPPLQSA